MANFNKNSGYGRIFADSYPARGGGKTFYVAKSGTKYYEHINQILDPDPEGDVRLFSTVEEAITKMNSRIDWSVSPWAVGDTLYIFPGTYAENLTALAHGCYIIGVGDDVRDGENGVVIQPASGDPVDVGALINTVVENMGFVTNGTNQAFDCAITNNCYFRRCFFSGPAESVTATYGFYTNDSVKTTWEDCWFCNAAIGLGFDYADANDSVSYAKIKDCQVTGCGTSGIYTSTNLVGPHSQIINTHCTGGGQSTTKQFDDNSNLFDVVMSTFEGTTATEGGRSFNGSYGNGALIT